MVCAVLSVHIKVPMLLIGKGSLHSGGSGFCLFLLEWFFTIYIFFSFCAGDGIDSEESRKDISSASQVEMARLGMFLERACQVNSSNTYNHKGIGIVLLSVF